MFFYSLSFVHNIPIFALDSFQPETLIKLGPATDCDVRIKVHFETDRTVKLMSECEQPQSIQNISNQRKLLRHRLKAQTDHSDPISHGRNDKYIIMTYFPETNKHWKSSKTITGRNRIVNYVKLIVSKTIEKTGHAYHNASFSLLIKVL